MTNFKRCIVWPMAEVPKFECVPESPRGLVNLQVAGPAPVWLTVSEDHNLQTAGSWNVWGSQALVALMDDHFTLLFLKDHFFFSACKTMLPSNLSSGNQGQGSSLGTSGIRLGVNLVPLTQIEVGSEFQRVSGPQCHCSGAGWVSNSYPTWAPGKAGGLWDFLDHRILVAFTTNTCVKVGPAHGHYLWISGYTSWSQPLLNWCTVQYAHSLQGAFCNSYISTFPKILYYLNANCLALVKFFGFYADISCFLIRLCTDVFLLT